MIRIANESELTNIFRPVDREDIIDMSTLQFPIVLTDYITWAEPSGHRQYLVFQDPAERGGAMWGVIFKRGSTTAAPVNEMCQLCHSVRSGNSISLLTASVTKNRRVGIHACRDLSCKDKVLGLPGVNDMREPYGAYEKLFRVLYRMSDFVKYSLLETKKTETGEPGDERTRH